MSQMFVLLIAFEFYFRGIQLFLAQIRNAMGLFQQLKYRPLISMLINLILSIILVQYFNIEGGILATIATSVLTNMIIDPIIIHSYGFSRTTWVYYIKNVYYIGLMTITGYLSYVLTQGFNETFMGMLLSFVVTTGGIMVLFTVGLVWLSEFRDLQKRVRQLLKK